MIGSLYRCTFEYVYSVLIQMRFFRRDKRAKPLIIDPGLYSTKKSDVFWVTPRRTMPTAFKLFTGNSVISE